MRTTRPINTDLGSYVPLLILITWLNFGTILFDTIFYGEFPLKIWMCQTLFWTFSGMVGPIGVKQKGSASIGYWVNYLSLNFDLNHDLDLGFLQSQISK